MTSLFIVRHGQREDSSTGGNTRPAARPCDPDITKIGQQQAWETGVKLSHESISFIYSSPFLRAVRTAALIADGCNTHNGFNASDGVKVRLEWGLAEWFRKDWWSEWPGTIPAEILTKMFPVIEPSTPTGIYPELQEEFWAMHARYLRTTNALIERHKGHNIVLVTHGGAVLSLPTGLITWELEGYANHRQCGISKLVKGDDGKWEAKYLNSVDHLTHVET